MSKDHLYVIGSVRNVTHKDLLFILQKAFFNTHKIFFFFPPPKIYWNKMSVHLQR